jgi:hypothetical protein
MDLNCAKNFRQKLPRLSLQFPPMAARVIAGVQRLVWFN